MKNSIRGRFPFWVIIILIIIGGTIGFIISGKIKQSIKMDLNNKTEKADSSFLNNKPISDSSHKCTKIH